jgi:hypothetical protein
MTVANGTKIEVGNRYASLEVLRRTDPPPGRHYNRAIWWLCRCDCGNEKPVLGTALRSRHTKSCGCRYFAYTALSNRGATNATVCRL